MNSQYPQVIIEAADEGGKRELEGKRESFKPSTPNDEEGKKPFFFFLHSVLLLASLFVLVFWHCRSTLEYFLLFSLLFVSEVSAWNAGEKENEKKRSGYLLRPPIISRPSSPPSLSGDNRS